MRDDDFIAWLKMQGRYNPSTTINTSGLRAIARRLKANLDEEWSKDDLQRLIESIRIQREGLPTGGPEYLELSGDITKSKAYGEFRLEGADQSKGASV
jgi:hypothetical protein